MFFLSPLFFFFFFFLDLFAVHKEDKKKQMENESEFERQLSKLLKDAAKGLEDLHSQFEDIDRNLQTVHSLGKQVYESAQLWQDFHKAINRNSVISFEHKEKPKA